MNTDQAFTLLKEAGITDNIETFKQWLREGKIKATGFTVDDKALMRFMKEQTKLDKDQVIHLLKLKIKTKDEEIKGIEELHASSTRLLIHQRDKLYNEISLLQIERNHLKKETINLLKENIELRDELIELKEKLLKGETSEDASSSSLSSSDFRQKLGLTKLANDKDIIAAYKELLKKAHPDHGGNAKLFHYIKTDFDQFRNKMKD
ncbi:hypothetical protein WQ54_18840 [Bacillus sp. SA1-12]|uniref:J domain-containing protein n=1 Tax=Bacillus sp. SA1-12 TaxID=1455638 RepID=UPI0006272E80|nr:J domain-containing protein [Bacillus sp. SA1-12]KKI90806.1 hypothetical protein WQ54_18840 [Bacillus sp. SA1-12]